MYLNKIKQVKCLIILFGLAVALTGCATPPTPRAVDTATTLTFPAEPYEIRSELEIIDREIERLNNELADLNDDDASTDDAKESKKKEIDAKKSEKLGIISKINKFQDSYVVIKGTFDKPVVQISPSATYSKDEILEPGDGGEETDRHPPQKAIAELDSPTEFKLIIKPFQSSKKEEAPHEILNYIEQVPGPYVFQVDFEYMSMGKKSMSKRFHHLLTRPEEAAQ